MIHCAHASRYHWGEVGDDVNLARGEWQCAACTRSSDGPSRRSGTPGGASRSTRPTGTREDWDLASAYEAMARACHVAGDGAGTAEWKAKALAALDG